MTWPDCIWWTWNNDISKMSFSTYGDLTYRTGLDSLDCGHAAFQPAASPLTADVYVSIADAWNLGKEIKAPSSPEHCDKKNRNIKHVIGVPGKYLMALRGGGGVGTRQTRWT